MIEEKAIKIIKNTFEAHTPLEIVGFYGKKLFLQWGIGDFGAYEWTVVNNPGISLSYKDTIILTPIAYILISIYYIFLIILCIKALIRLKERKNSKLMFYCLILLGFIGFYMLTERQSRYAFVCSWLIILIASGAFYKKMK